MNKQEFPTLGGAAQQSSDPNSTQQMSLGGTPSGFNLTSSEFSLTSTEFNPTGIIAKDEFPDLDQAFGGQSKKKKGPTKEEIEAQKKAAIEALPTKGKPEQFFYHQGTYLPPNQEQMIFVWAYYPQYSLCPHTILEWLVVEARRIFNEEQAAKQLEQEAYGSGPQNRTSNYNNND